MVPLGTLVNVNRVKSDRGGPIVVTRYNLYTAASITGNMLPGFSSGDAIASINEVTHETLPLSMTGEWTELMFVQIRAAERNPALYVFGLAVVSVFLALAALYESWALPLAVILVVPMCLLCSVSGVRYTNRDVNIFVQIGLVVLVGLACKNAILIVEYAKQKHREGWSRHDATREACRLRLRPILMTSLAFIIGVIPLAVAAGAGAEMRRSLGIAVFSGMLGVTLFGIFLTPVFFSVIQGLSETRMFTAVATRWAGSTLLSGLAGLGIGFMLAQLGVMRLSWALQIGGSAGCLAALAVLGLHRMIRYQTSAQRRALPYPTNVRCSGRRSISRDFALLHRPSGLCHRPLGRLCTGGRGGRIHASSRAVPRGDAPHGTGNGFLPGGQRADGTGTPWPRRSRSKSAASRT